MSTIIVLLADLADLSNPPCTKAYPNISEYSKVKTHHIRWETSYMSIDTPILHVVDESSQKEFHCDNRLQCCYSLLSEEPSQKNRALLP